MKLINYFVMPYTRNYSIQEEYVLALIELNSDSKISHITRDKLCQLSGIKSVDVISKYTNKFQEDKHLKKVNKYISGKNLLEYHLMPSSNYIVVYNSLLQFGECSGLAIKMAKLRFNGTSEIRMSNNEIIKKLDLNKATYLKYRNMLLKNNILIKTDNGFSLNSEYIPVIHSKPTEKQKEKIDFILSQDSKAKNILLSYYCPETNTFNGLKGSADDFINFLLAGCPKNSKQEEINILI